MKVSQLDMHIVFCGDRTALPGLHVAAYSVLDRLGATSCKLSFHLFSDDWRDDDLTLLYDTFARTAKPFALEHHRVDPNRFAHLPRMGGSFAPYYRFLAADVLEISRFLYLDADVLCDVDVSELAALDLTGAVAALVPEAPLENCIDQTLSRQLTNCDDRHYYNAGVALIDVDRWRKNNVTRQCLDYISTNQPRFYDQSALNFVLRGKTFPLNPKFNCIANMRQNWPALKKPYKSIGKVVHFADYPKPWGFLGEWVHPHYKLWNSVLKRTVMRKSRSRPVLADLLTRRHLSLSSYKKALKDRMLFTGYSRGWLTRVKGVPVAAGVI